MKILLNILALSLLVFVTAKAYQGLSKEVVAQSAETQQEEVLYLPSGEGLRLLSFGYHNLLSNLLWFNTVSYFGKHFKSDRNYKWLNHMCNLVVNLNPEAHHVFDFCSVMLAWEAKAPKKSIAILSKAIKHHPNYWKYPYLRGFINLFFLKNEEEARADMVRAAELPDAHLLVKRLAAKKLAVDDPDTAISFLSDMLKTANDPSQRKALEERLREARYESDIRKLEQALKLYIAKTGKEATSLNDLVEAGIIGKALSDPFGGSYFLDKESGNIQSTSGRKRLRIYKK